MLRQVRSGRRCRPTDSWADLPPPMTVFAHPCHSRYALAMQMTSMNISIPDSLREFVEAQVRELGYNSASEYVRELIRDARARVTQETELKELVKLGLAQLRQGDSLELDDTSLATFFEEAKSRARKRLAQKKAPRG